MAGHIDPVAQGIGAEQRGLGIIAEDIDQRAGVDRIDMLGIERQAGARQPVGNPAMHRAQPPDRGEQAEHAAARCLDESPVSPCQRGETEPQDEADADQRPGVDLGGRALASERHGSAVAYGAAVITTEPVRPDYGGASLEQVVPALVGRVDDDVRQLLLDEAVALDLADVDFEQEAVHVRGKGGKERIVPLGEVLDHIPGLPHDGFYPLSRFVRWLVDDC